MAGSPNAFAQLPSGTARLSSVLSETDGNARASKRPRLCEDAVAAIHTQSARSDTSLEVDHMMLDYLAYQTIRSCLASRNLGVNGVSHVSLANNLTSFNAFHSIFTSRYPTYQPDTELHLRILLLKFTTLFTQRYTNNPTTPSHDALIKIRRNRDRDQSCWDSFKFDAIDFHVEPPLSVEDLERYRAHVLYELGIPAEDSQYEDPFYGTSSCVSLLDMLPSFMHLSAARNTMNSSNLTERWMQLACEFMLQACLEQFLVIGQSAMALSISEAFAWGYNPSAIDTEGRSGSQANNAMDAGVNSMFEDEEYAIEIDGWNEMKALYVKELLDSPSDRVDGDRDHTKISHLEDIASQHPISAFEASLLKFLEAISNSIPKPVLIQLEDGTLDGMTKHETLQFLEDCGASVTSFFEAPVGFKSDERLWSQPLQWTDWITQQFNAWN